jgi:hypothetical protein
MKKTHILSHTLSAVLIVLAVFFLPLENLGVHSALAGEPTESVDLQFLIPPPDNMCLNDTVPISFFWQLYINPGKGKPTLAAENGSASGVINATAASGTLAQTSFPLFVPMGSEEYVTTFKATKTGTGKITLTPGGGLGGDPVIAGPFNIVNCTGTISIAASNYKGGAAISMDTEFHGKGGFKIDDKGKVAGGGSYTFTITTFYKPEPSSGLTCEPAKKADRDSTFNITGTSFGGGYNFTLEFNPLTLPATNFECVDAAGKKSYVPGYGGGSVDPASTGFFNPLLLAPGESNKSFSFGEGGSGNIWVVKRKGK